jgi:arginyl-tRNA synthetase
MEAKIRSAIQKALLDLGAADTVFVVERPPELLHGDYSTNAALAAAKVLNTNSRTIADELAQTLKDVLDSSVERVDVAGPGFINISLSREAVALAIVEAGAKGEEWGTGNAEEGQRVMIEYTDPNPFKEMHIGHLMSNVIGEATARLIGNQSAKVIRANYQGDIGPHVAKAIWGLRKKGKLEPTSAAEIGEAYAIGAQSYENDPDIKKEIDEINAALYSGKDTPLMELWRKGRDVSLTAFEHLYKILGTKFDYYFFESEVYESGIRIVSDGIERGLFEESEGAVIYRGENKGLHTLVFITSRGTPTYEAKEIGLAFAKEERVPTDKVLILTAAEQIGHFKVVLAALADLAPLVAEKTKHIPHGFLRLSSGKMSSREGNVITAAGLVDDVIRKASEKNSDPLIAEQVAIGAIKYMILRQSPGSDIIFDPEKSLSLEGDSGPYLQYALVRAKKILAYGEHGAGGTEQPEIPYDIERIILHYPGVAARAARELSPNLLVSYLTELASVWNSFYAKEQVLGSPEEMYKQRIARAFMNTMTNGLTLLGIPAPEKM